MQEVHISARSIQLFEPLLGNQRVRALERQAAAIRDALRTCAIWNISSTAVGGGVSEMLHSLLRYARGVGVDVRWLVLEGPPEFFRVTKRVHHALHGSAGDGSPLGAEQAALVEAVMHENALALESLVRPGDIVICHDPQTAGLVPILMRKGARVVFRCHVGQERHLAEVERGWNFLRPYIERVPLAVFTREAYAPAWLHGKRTFVLPPNIDPFSAKNQSMDDFTIRAILAQVGLIEGPWESAHSCFVRDDGSAGRVDREADVVRVGRPPSWDTPLVVQVSRWDAMKDPIGVLRGFARFVDPAASRTAHLVLAGPSIGAVADDPEGAKVFGDVQQAYLELPDAVRRRVHLALLPMTDPEENAAIVNALQRHAAVIVQKSLVEGFGLTVTEALWKRRPVVASAVGGIVDQIRDGMDGLLVRNPSDLAEFSGALRRVLDDEVLSRRLGEAGYRRVCANYLSLSALERWAELIHQILTL
ncbi:MAG TPA: glycosyltransferase [Polyangiaceae bacterium]|nr:glycosyltransferase [Polyangiaceae bacterium]